VVGGGHSQPALGHRRSSRRGFAGRPSTPTSAFCRGRPPPSWLYQQRERVRPRTAARARRAHALAALRRRARRPLMTAAVGGRALSPHYHPRRPASVRSVLHLRRGEAGVFLTSPARRRAPTRRTRARRTSSTRSSYRLRRRPARAAPVPCDQGRQARADGVLSQNGGGLWSSRERSVRSWAIAGASAAAAGHAGVRAARQGSGDGPRIRTCVAHGVRLGFRDFVLLTYAGTGRSEHPYGA